jgi:amino-acid N-acetyltransferase
LQTGCAHREAGSAPIAEGSVRVAFMTSEVIHARPSRAAAIALLDAAALPSSDLTDAHMEHFFFCGSADVLTALVGLELHGASALLRSLVVHPDVRSTGIGKMLVAHAETRARARSVRAVYLLTTTASGFFQRRGYTLAARETAPSEIRTTREFADICPASSAFMVKHL